MNPSKSGITSKQATTVAEQQKAEQLTVATLLELCHQFASLPPSAQSGYRPTAAQIGFFTLLWATKLGIVWHPLKLHTILCDETDNLLTAPVAEAHSRDVAAQLDEWGGTVTGLQRRDAHEWELLRIQMEKMLRGRGADEAADALQDALLKIFQMVSRMTLGDEIESTGDVVGLTYSRLNAHTATYRFDRPFYPYAKRIAENQLFSHFRQTLRTNMVDVDELAEVLVASTETQGTVSGTQDEEIPAALQQLLQGELSRLLVIVQRDLTPKPRQVVLATLAARPKFWTALTLCGVSAPAGYLPPVQEPDGTEMEAKELDDKELAQQLGMSENTVRVHRAHAKQTIGGVDTFLGLLLDSLMAPAQRMGHYLELRHALQIALRQE